jgi:hypothetical protein
VISAGTAEMRCDLNARLATTVALLRKLTRPILLGFTKIGTSAAFAVFFTWWRRNHNGRRAVGLAEFAVVLKRVSG